jgi:hypothetical protein
MALVMAVGMMGVLAIVGGGVTYYSASNARSAHVSETQNVAYSLAEAGIAHGLSKLNNALNPLQANLLPSTTVNMDGGSVTYSGTLSGYVWTITSTGSALNPTGAAASSIKRTLTRSAQVYGVNSGASVAAWSRVYHADPNTCLTITDVTITMPIAAAGDLCLVGSAKVTGAETTLEAGDDVIMTPAPADNSDRNADSDGGALNSTSSGTGTAWSSLGSIVSSNNFYASSTNIPANGGQSADLNAMGFGFNIPSTATILGIRVEIERLANASSSIVDRDVLLLKAGVPSGSDKANTGATWPTSTITPQYGGSTDLWGTTWTPAQINASNFGVRLRVTNSNSASSRTAQVDHVAITVWYQRAIDTRIGDAAAPIAWVQVGDTCKYNTQAAHKPCTSTDKVWAETIGSTPEQLTKPAIDLPYWYTNAAPGPMHNCTTGSFPGGFDNDTYYNNSRIGSPEITPTSSSYTCEFRDAQNNLLGELSWNHVTHVLKIKGTIFIDGDMRFDDDGQVVHYQGRGIIYAAGDVEFDELVCAGGSGTTSCVDTGMENWDPTTNMMIVLSGGWSEYDQGSTQSQPVPSGLQGILYAQDHCLIHENFHMSGPVVCDQIQLPSEPNGWPTYYPWPDLGSLVDGQIYADPTTAGDFLVVPGQQSG